MPSPDAIEPLSESASSAASHDRELPANERANSPPSAGLREQLGNLLRRYPLLFFAAALIAGGQAARLLPDLPWLGGAGLAILLGLILTGFLLRHDRRPGRQPLIALTACLLLGVMWSLSSKPPEADGLSPTASRESRPIAMRAVIAAAAEWKPNPNFRSQDPESEPWITQWEITCQAVRDGAQWQPLKAQSTLSVAGRVSRFLPGDQIEFYGSYRRIGNPTNPGAFDFARRSQQESRFVLLNADSAQQLHPLGTTSLYPLQRIRGRAIRYVDNNLTRWIDPEYAPLAAALIFGQRQQVDWEDQQELMATGTLHMLAISGMHVEIVAWGVIAVCILSCTRDPWRVMIVIAICGLYACLAGGKPPVVRAVVIVAAFEWARVLGRRARLTNLLGLAAMVLFVMKSANIENVGVHLSFLAVAAIGIFVLDRDPHSLDSAFSRLLSESAGKAKRWLRLASTWLWATLRLSFWVWLVTCPLVWSNFHIVAPVAILLNVLIALPLCVALLSGLVAGLLGGLAPIGYVSGWICSLHLSLIATLINWGKNIPAGHVWLPAPGLWWQVTFFAILALWLLVFRRKYRWQLAASLSAWMLVGIAWFGSGQLQPKEPEHLLVTFLDVGHGTSVIVHTPNNEVWLYDAGHLGSSDRSHQEIANALWHMGAARIDTLVLSHADADHYNAVPGLCERFHIHRVASTPQFWDSPDANVRSLIARLRERGVRTETWVADHHGEAGSATWRILHPAAEQQFESDNASSLCLLFAFAGQRVLLPGDLDGTGLRCLTTLPDRPCQLIMAPHHGSLTHDPTALLEWCRPDWIVISGNHRAVRPEVLQEYAVAPTLVTFRDGAIQYRISANGQASVYRWQTRRWEPIALR